MVHILTALYPEALPIIEYFGLKKDFNYNEFEHFTKDDLSLSITGIGGIKAASVFSYLFSKTKEDFFLLIGVCGAKNKYINIGDIFLINKAIQNDSKKNFYPDIIFSHNLNENSIESFGKVINYLSSDIEGELIDMESAYFLEAAQFFLPPHKSHVLKIVSDHLDIRNITKDFISKIVEKNLKNINDIINSLKELHKFEQKEVLSSEETNFLLTIKENLNLTEYMKNELFNLYRISKVRKNISIENLKEFLMYKSKTKQERKKYYDKIKNALL